MIVDLIKVGLMVTLSHLISSPFSYTLISRLKMNDLRWLVWKFDSPDELVFWASLTIQPVYLLSGFILFKAHWFGASVFHAAYISVIANLIAMNVTTIIFMYLKVGETPNKYEWMALFFALLAGFCIVLSAYSHRG